jgi:hypothetical protein
MALSEQVESSLKEAESNLRNALAFSARNEKPFVNVVIAKMIRDIDSVISTENLLDQLENHSRNDPESWGNIFGK